MISEYLFSNSRTESNPKLIYLIAKKYLIPFIKILVQFVPVFNMGKFIGKHVIKILIKQGDPAELYCFTKKIQLESVKDKKV